MPEKTRRTPARLLALLALAVCTVAFVAVLATSGVDGGGEEGGGDRREAAPAASGATETTPERPRRRSTYVVKVGDTLGDIAEKTQVDVETIQELNPEIDAQALSPGQQIKLR